MSTGFSGRFAPAPVSSIRCLWTWDPRATQKPRSSLDIPRNMVNISLGITPVTPVTGVVGGLPDGRGNKPRHRAVKRGAAAALKPVNLRPPFLNLGAQ